jgi:hypothetical protein
MLRSALIAVFVTALGTIVGSGSATATITVFGDMSYIIAQGCSSPDCVATLDPSRPEVQINVTAGSGLPNVNVFNSVDFTLTIDNHGDHFAFADLRVLYDFSMTFTNPLGVFGSYRYVDGFFTFGSCSYPPRGSAGPGPSGCTFEDSNDLGVFVGPDTDMTFGVTGTINAQAGTIPEPSSVGMLVSALLVFGWLQHRRTTPPTTGALSR